jgi:hypothetical protein
MTAKDRAAELKKRSKLRAPRQSLRDIEAFFIDYNPRDDKRFHPLGAHGPRRAAKLVKKGITVFNKQRRSGQK